jgi:hypothetical protein
MSDDYCKICNAPLNEDGTTEFCAGECDRQVLPEYSPMHELDFNDDNTRRGFNDILPTEDPYSYENLIDQAELESEEYDDWLPEQNDDYWND